GPLALVERREDPAVGVHAGGDVADGDAHLRRLLRRTGDRHDAGLALHEQVIRLLRAVRPGVAVAGDRAVDQLRSLRAQRVRVQPEALHGTGDQVLQEDVRLRYERVEDRAVPRVLDVELDALLAPVEPHEVARVAVHGAVVLAREVTDPGTLHLDDTRTQIREMPGRQRSGDRLLQRDDGDVLQRMHGRV